jgi:hypothetical protein
MEDTGYTGVSMGWAVSEYEREPNAPERRWHWWARFNNEIREGHKPSWAEAIGAAKRAYDELETTA